MPAIPKFHNYISKRTGGPQSVLVSLDITGLAELMEKMEEIRVDGMKAMGRALYAEALLIVAEAKKLTPVRFGILRASGHVNTPDVSESRVSVEMGFGGPAGIGNVGGDSNTANVGYALPVHENLSARHPNGQAKFLEQPVLAAANGIDARLAVRIRADLGLT